jgi:hypothetical protein
LTSVNLAAVFAQEYGTHSPATDRSQTLALSYSKASLVLPRETRVGWPLLTVVTELNGDSKSTYERCPSLVGSLGLSCRYEIFVLLWLLWSSQCKINYSSPVNCFIFLSPSLSKLGWQLCWVACLLVCVSGLNCHLCFPVVYYYILPNMVHVPIGHVFGFSYVYAASLCILIYLHHAVKNVNQMSTVVT